MYLDLGPASLLKGLRPCLAWKAARALLTPLAVMPSIWPADTLSWISRLALRRSVYQACAEDRTAHLDLSLASLLKGLPDAVPGLEGGQGPVGPLCSYAQHLAHRRTHHALLACAVASHNLPRCRSPFAGVKKNMFTGQDTGLSKLGHQKTSSPPAWLLTHVCRHEKGDKARLQIWR